ILDRGYSGQLAMGEPLHRHCSLRVGGAAGLFAVPESTGDLRVLMESLGRDAIPWILIGGGTNVVFSNGGYSGCVVRLGEEFSRVRREEETLVTAGAAAALPRLVTFAGREGLAGLECLAGIPGSVGGAVRMNAGTREGEIGDVVEQVQIFDGREPQWIPGQEMGFSYRRTILPEDRVILAVRLRLRAETGEAVRSRVAQQMERRRTSQPTGVASAGCWFRNPEGDSAGRLIDAAGMKGVRCGGAQVSPVHANFLVNTGGATAADFLALAGKVKETVHERFGISLEEEVRIIHG
ncbi:MAG: UDP-N-acetylmuramate dehydrogenase, partial [bacterium]